MYDLICESWSECNYPVNLINLCQLFIIIDRVHAFIPTCRPPGTSYDITFKCIQYVVTYLTYRIANLTIQYIYAYLYIVRLWCMQLSVLYKKVNDTARLLELRSYNSLFLVYVLIFCYIVFNLKVKYLKI